MAHAYTIAPDSPLAMSFRFARRWGGHSLNGTRRPAWAAIVNAREACEAARAGRLAFESASAYRASLESSGGSALGLGCEGSASWAARVAEARQSEARARAHAASVGIYAGSVSWAAWAHSPGNKSPDGTAYHCTSPDARGIARGLWAAHARDLPDGRPVSHRGWYCDPDESGLCWGVVAQLSARDGAPRYLAGYQFSETDQGPTLCLTRVFDNAPDAARYGDGMAERMAESEKAYQSAWRAGQRWAELGGEVKTQRAEALGLLAERRAARAGAAMAYPQTCKALARLIGQIWGEIAKARAERAELARGDCPGLYWSYGEKAELSGFAEGAELSEAEALRVARYA